MIYQLGTTPEDAAHTLLQHAETSPHGAELSLAARSQLASLLGAPAAATCVWLSGQAMRLCAEKLLEPARVC
jgi:hypothetical protein